MRKLAKTIAVYTCLLFIFPCIILVWLEQKLSGREEVFSFFSQMLSLVPGKLGSYFRVAYYMQTLKQCSVNTFIAFGTFFSHRNVIIEENVGIGGYCIIGCAHLGKDVMVASRVSITSGKVQHIAPNGRITRNVALHVVSVGAKSWIGEGAVVMDDVGEECIVAAGCVVSRRIPSKALAGGNPCRILKNKYYEGIMKANEK